MPFTPAHVVAILPFVRTPLAPAALAIGAMAPDLPYFVPVGIEREFSHSLVGAPTIDLAVGLIAFTLWLLVLRAPVLDYSPGWLRERMASAARWRVRGPVVSGLLVIVALELGILTHLFLDLFTHEGGWLETIAPWTSYELGPIAIANIIHAVVSLVLTIVLALWVRRWALRTPSTPRDSKLGNGERVTTWIALAALVAVIGAIWWIVGIISGIHPLEPDLLGHAFIGAAAIAAGVGFVLAIVWHVRKR